MADTFGGLGNMEELVKSFDKNQNGLVEFDEFFEARLAFMELFFNKFDTNKNGYIEKEEFKGLTKFFLMITDPNATVSDEELQVFVEGILPELDKNHDGKVSF